MKRLFLSLSIVASFLAVTSCEDDGGDLTINQTITNNNGDNTGGNVSEDAINVTGNVESGETLTLDADKEYVLKGALNVKEGGTLVIPAGTKITATNGAGVYIAVLQGATILAQGTNSEPIILTAENEEPGAWGGLIVCGKAPINAGATATSEIGQFTYGGDQPDDDSGTISHVVIEYSGNAVDGNSENNGFTFYGVGRGTTVEYIESYYGSDDGVEFFGGTVEASNLIMIGNEDDQVDWTEGFSGKLTDVYIRHEGDAWDKAIEADGFNPEVGLNVSPAFYSNPTLTNVTIDGLGSGTTEQGGDPIDAGTYEAIRLREGTAGTFENVMINGFGRGYRLKGNEDGFGGLLTSADHVVNGDLTATGYYNDVTDIVKNSVESTPFDDADLFTENTSATGTDVDTWGASWAVGL